MTDIEHVVADFEAQAGDSLPRVHRGELTPLPLRVSLLRHPRPAPPPVGSDNYPPDLVWLWTHVALARLFEDALYGQWGLVLYSGADAAAATVRLRSERPREVSGGDIVVGEFLGDCDLVVVRCDRGSDDFGAVLIALPIEGRRAWPVVASSVTSFLSQFLAAQGAKYWDA